MSAALQQEARNKLASLIRDGLGRLEDYCYPEKILWPSQNELGKLHLSILALAYYCYPHKNTILPPREIKELTAKLNSREKPWKAYEVVDRRHPKFQLVRRVKAILRRAGERLKEVRESELNRFMRKADQSGQRTQSELVHRLLGIAYGDPHFKAANIQWEDYEQLLFRGDNNKPVQFACGDLPGDRRLRCYARALEIVADDMRFRPFRDKVQPIATWVLHMGNPDLVKMLGYYELESVSEHRARQHADEARKHKQEQSRKRQKKHRDKKRRAELLARGISEADIEEIFAGNA
jgi:hypothetical protein